MKNETSITIKLSSSIIKRLKQHSRACYHSVNKEIKQRLEQSLHQEDQPDNLALIRYWLDQQKSLQKGNNIL